MTDKERIEMLARENKQLKIYLDFFSKQSEISMNYIWEDMEHRMGETSTQELEKALFDMVVAYATKCEELPHDGEIEALKNAKNLLTKPSCQKYAEGVYEGTKYKAFRKSSSLAGKTASTYCIDEPIESEEQNDR